MFQFNNTIKAGVKKQIKTIEDNELSKLIKNKTGVSLSKFRIVQSPKFFGGMSGIPGLPIMYLSSGLYQTFSKKHIEYVLLHEVGHYKLLHPVKHALSQVILALLGLYIISLFSFNVVAIFLAALLMGILYHQYALWSEREAENYAAKRISDPNYMIEAVKLFKKNWGDTYPLWFKKLFGPNISYEEKIKIAKSYL